MGDSKIDGPGIQRARLLEALVLHVPVDEAEAGNLAQIRAFAERHPDPFDRKIPEGHLTASALILRATGDVAVLLYHRKLERWLQPGGHAEPGESAGEAVALREAAEETGLRGLSLWPEAQRPFDVDVHDIPAHGNDPAHLHLDLRYAVCAPADATFSDEARERRRLLWVGWQGLSDYGLDPGLLRAFSKLRRLASVG